MTPFDPYNKLPIIKVAYNKLGTTFGSLGGSCKRPTTPFLIFLCLYPSLPPMALPLRQEKKHWVVQISTQRDLGKVYRRLNDANRVGCTIERTMEAIATTLLLLPSIEQHDLRFEHRNLLWFLSGLIKHIEETINFCMIRTMCMWLDFYSEKYLIDY